MNYWLVKSEPEEFSLNDLKEKGIEPWTGVRNFQARNFMRDGMHPGDPVLFYHSSTAPLGIVGLANVATKAYPDPTQFEVGGEYFEPRATPENPVWFLVDLAYKETFPKILTLEAIKADPILSSMRVAQRGSRLSVQPVDENHFKRVLELVKN